MTNNPVALILGSGPRVGNSVARRLANNGYAVAVASRKGTGSRNDQGVLDIKADFSHVESIQHVFSTVKAEFGQPPSIVIYNAAALTPPPVQNLILSIQPEQLASDLTVNTISPFAAAQKAVDEWESLKSDAAKVFIYTGNISNVQLVPMPLTVTLGVGKSASSYWIGMADKVYSDRGYRFFYADERNADGSIKGQELDGEAHADFYSELAHGTVDIPWHATFVKGKGYTKF